MRALLAFSFASFVSFVVITPRGMHAAAQEATTQPAGRTVCATCGGKRAVDCPHCHGDYRHAKGVRVLCEAKEGTGCAGSGVRDCFACLGRGVVDCKRCIGKGYIVYERTKGGVVRREWQHPCYTCDETGKVRCLECGRNGLVAGQIICPRCKGTGIVTLKGGTCPYCKKGRMACPDCSGGVTPEQVLKRERGVDEVPEVRSLPDPPPRRPPDPEPDGQAEPRNDAGPRTPPAGEGVGRGGGGTRTPPPVPPGGQPQPPAPQPQTKQNKVNPPNPPPARIPPPVPGQAPPGRGRG